MSEIYIRGYSYFGQETFIQEAEFEMCGVRILQHAAYVPVKAAISSYSIPTRVTIFFKLEVFFCQLVGLYCQEQN